MNTTINKFTRPNTQKLVEYNLNTKIFIDFRLQEKTKHKSIREYFLLSNRINKLFEQIKEISKN